MNSERWCPACASPFMLYVQDVLGRRTGKQIPQYFCMDCKSFSNPSGYSEDDAQKQADANFFISERETSYRQQSQLALEIFHRAPSIKTVCEIGSGAGFFLRACGDYGRTARGFEVNEYAVGFARDGMGVRVDNALFTEDHPDRYDLMVTIGVLEHVPDPRGLFRLMASKLTPNGCIYANVPFVNREQWPYLATASTDPALAPPDPFYDNDVHITHFSKEGLLLMGSQLGARSWDFWESKDVVSHSAGSYPGVLFQF